MDKFLKTNSYKFRPTELESVISGGEVRSPYPIPHSPGSPPPGSEVLNIHAHHLLKSASRIRSGQGVAARMGASWIRFEPAPPRLIR